MKIIIFFWSLTSIAFFFCFNSFLNSNYRFLQFHLIRLFFIQIYKKKKREINQKQKQNCKFKTVISNVFIWFVEFHRHILSTMRSKLVKLCLKISWPKSFSHLYARFNCWMHTHFLIYNFWLNWSRIKFN